MARVTKDHLDRALTNLKRNAVEARLMSRDDALIYDRGVAAGGVPAAVYVGRRGSHAGFVPRFTLDQSQREQVAIMEAISAALFAVNHKTVEVSK